MSDKDLIVYEKEQIRVTPTASSSLTLTTNANSTPTARRRKQAKPRAFKRKHLLKNVFLLLLLFFMSVK
jgi:hypothetical protein